MVSAGYVVDSMEMQMGLDFRSLGASHCELGAYFPTEILLHKW